MTSLQKRVLTFAVGVPAISCVILLLPQWNHAVFNLIAVISVGFGSRETANLFREKGYSIPAYIPFAAGLLPLSAWLMLRGLVSFNLIEFLIVAMCMLVLIREIDAREDDDFNTALPRIGGSLLTFLYPGLFAVYAVQITSFPGAGLKLFAFLILVFSNDTAAYIFGSLFGRSSTKPLRVSPNKSIVGFVSGFVTTIIIALLIHQLFPTVFAHPKTAVLAGIAVGITAIIGDLAESALKRSAVIKDSGDLIPGRGGILDSIDSIIFSAPLFYLILKLYL